MRPFVKTLLAAALALATAHAYGMEPYHARLVLRNPEAFYPAVNEPDLRVLRITDPATDQDRMSIVTDGTVIFSPGATVNFSGIHFAAGNIGGFVLVRVMGRPMLVPVFDLAPGATLGPEWGAAPAEQR